MNLVTLCSICHGQIHGFIPLGEKVGNGFALYPEEFSIQSMDEAVMEYLADYYAPDWYPYK